LLDDDFLPNEDDAVDGTGGGAVGAMILIRSASLNCLRHRGQVAFPPAPPALAPPPPPFDCSNLTHWTMQSSHAKCAHLMNVGRLLSGHPSWHTQQVGAPPCRKLGREKFRV